MRGPPIWNPPMRGPPMWNPPMCPPPKCPPPNLASAEVEKLKTMSSAKAAPPRVASLLAMDLLRLAACPPASCKDNAELQGIPSRRWRRPNSHALFAALAFTREEAILRPCQKTTAQIEIVCATMMLDA